MADYPYLSGTSPTRTRTDSFSGLDRRDRASAGAVRDGLHLSPDALPALRVCPADEKVQDLTACTDLLSACGCLIWTSGGNLYVDGVNKGGVRDEKHQMVVLGKRLFLFPEKQYLTLGESGGLQNMEARVVGGATFTDDSLEQGLFGRGRRDHRKVHALPGKQQDRRRARDRRQYPDFLRGMLYRGH